MVLVEAFAFVFGAVVGSFLNVLVYRLGSGRGLGGRSSCLSCGKTLEVPDLVPIFSYVFLRGRCRRCGSHISLQYPLVELVTAITFALIVHLTQEPVSTAALFILFSLLIAIGAYDMRHKIVPNLLVYPFNFLALSLVIYGAFESKNVELAIWYVAAGFFFALPLFLIWLLSKGRAMGLGDAKLALGLGCMLGPAASISAFVFAFWSGAIVGMLMLLIQRLSLHAKAAPLTIKSEIPFAPFLIFGASLVILIGVELPAISSFVHVF